MYIYPPAPSGHTAAEEMHQTSSSFSFSFSFSLSFSFSFSFFFFSFFFFSFSFLLVCPSCLLLVCLFAHLVWLLVRPRARQITFQNHVLLLLGLPEFACGPSAVHIFAFEPHQARSYMHQTCHSTATCPKSPQSWTKVPPKCSKVTPKCSTSSIKVCQLICKIIKIRWENVYFLKIRESGTKATFIHPKVTPK